MILAHKIALDTNKNQEIHFAKAAGTARFAYNWALCECSEWTRHEYGVIHDCDVNASRNILGFGLANPNGSTANSAGINACGEEVSSHHCKVMVKPSSMKREASYVGVLE